MPDVGGTYLPPVVLSIVADAGDALRAIAEIKAALADLPKSKTIRITVKQNEVIEQIAQAEAVAATAQDYFETHPLQVDVDETAVRDLEARLQALKDEIETPVNVSITSDDPSIVAAQLAQLRASIAAINAEKVLIRVEPDIGALDAAVAAVEETLARGIEVPFYIEQNALIEQLARVQAFAATTEDYFETHPWQIHFDETAIRERVARLQALKEEIEKPIDVSIKLDDPSLVESQLARLRADIAAFDAEKVRIKVEADMSAFSAAVAAAEASLREGGEGGGPFSGFRGLGGALGGLGGAFGGLLGAMGWGKGAGIPGIGGGGMAGFGSILGMAGFGLEHVLSTLVGVLGSLAGGVAGGGLLAAGSLGVTAVGMGTDMAGIGQAAGDIRNVVQAQNALNEAVAKYGPTSRQAAAAQLQLNYALDSFNPVARGAVLNTANLIQNFKTMFDNVTGQAEAMGATIIGEFVKVGEVYLPTIGKFAAENMAIIQKAIQPFLAWLAGPGLAIFTELERKFQSDLPTALQALTQGFELFARTIGYIAPQTGGLVKAIADFVTKYNGVDWGKWAHGVDTLVGLFHTWMAFFKALASDLIAFFKDSAGLGAGLAQQLTVMLDHLHAYLTSASGMAAVTGLMRAHKDEIINIINALVPLIGIVGQLYLAISPSLVDAVAFLARALDGLLHVPVVGTILGWSLGLLLLWNRLKIVSTVEGLARSFRELMTVIGTFASGIGGILSSAGHLAQMMSSLYTESRALNAVMGAGLLGIIAALGFGVYELAKHFGILRTAMILGAVAVGILAAAWLGFINLPIIDIIALIAAAIAGVIAGIIYLVTHWREEWHAMESAALAVWHAVDAGFHTLASALVSGWDWLATHWHDIWNGIKGVFDDAVRFLRSGFGTLVVLITGPFAPLLLLALHWQQVWAGIKTDVSNFVNFFRGVPGDIMAAVGDLVKLGENIVKGIIHGLEQGIKDLGDAVAHVGHTILNGLKSVLHIFSPSADTLTIGQQLMEGLSAGISSGAGQTVTAATNAVNAILNALGGLSRVQTLANTVSTIKNLFQNLQTVLTDLAKIPGQVQAIDFGAVVTGFQKFTNLAPSLKGMATAIDGTSSSVRNLNTALGPLKGLLTTLDTIGGDLVTIQTDFAKVNFSTVIAAFTQLSTLIPQLVPMIDSMRSSLHKLGELGPVNSALKGLGTVFTSFGTMLNDLANLVRTAAGMNIPQDFATLKTVAQQLQTGMQQVWTQMKADAHTHWDNLSSYIHSITKNFLDPIKSLTGNIDNVARHLKNAWQTMDTDLNSGWRIILTDVGKMPNQMEAPFKAMIPQMTAIGTGLMDGLAAGITAGTPAAVNAAVAAAQAVLTALRSATGTHSPSTVYAAVARDWMAGLTQGIESGTAAVARAMTEAASRIVPHGLAATAGIGGFAGLGGQTVVSSPTITINAPTGNAPDIKRAVQQALQEHERNLVLQLRAL